MDENKISNSDSMQIVDVFSDNMRVAIKDIAAQVNDMKIALSGNTGDGRKIDGEVFANLTLCYRHLEDASMRLGKVKQFNGNGESPYDPNVVGSKN